MCSFSEEGHRVWKWFYQGDNEEGRHRPNGMCRDMGRKCGFLCKRPAHSVKLDPPRRGES